MNPVIFGSCVGQKVVVVLRGISRGGPLTDLQ